MHITRELAAKLLFTLMLVVMGAGYYSSRQSTPPVISTPGIESSSCGQFAATYEHNSTDPNHDHNSNAYGITEELSHAHVTADYRNWLGNNLSELVTKDTQEKYRTMTPSRLAGLLYTLYRVCRVNPEQSFVTVISSVLNNVPGLKSAETYVEGSDGE
jgi:hypothetical protein